MKKLLVVLLTLALICALPLFAMAEEPATTASTTEVGDVDAPEAEMETEAESETEYKMNVGFYPQTLMETLPVMGMGMLGIFIVTCVIVLAVLVLSKVGGKSEED